MLRSRAKHLVSILFLLWTLMGQAQFFQENKGQWNDAVVHRLDLGEASLFFEEQGITFDLTHPDDLALRAAAHTMKEVDLPEVMRHHAYRVVFENSDPFTEIEALDQRSGRHHFFHGDDPSAWASDVSSYQRIRYQGLYPNTDLEFYMSHGHLKYDFVLFPDAHPGHIKLSYEGVRPRIDKEGRLILKTSVNTIIEQRPYAYQEIDGQRIEIPCNYTWDGHLGFELGEYDTSVKLVIDPVLIFSTYSGSTSDNFGFTATFDDNGNLYSGSIAFGTGYPTTTGAYDVSFNGGTGTSDLSVGVDIVLTKYDVTGTEMIYSTYIGGDSDEAPHSIIVNEQEELIVFGTTGSNNYPTISGSYDQSFEGGFDVQVNGSGCRFPNGTDIILSKLSPDGSELLASTFVGGSANDGLNTAPTTNVNYGDEFRGEVDLDQNGNIIVASSSRASGATNDFPTTPGVFGETNNGNNQEGILFKMNPDLTELLWSTFIGGGSHDAAYSIAADDNGELFACGGTTSDDLVTSVNSLEPVYQGGLADGWVIRISEDATDVIALSYWGTGTQDQSYLLELNDEGHVHLYGQTNDGDALIDNAAYSVANSGLFVSKMTTDLETLIWSTAFGNGSGVPNLSPTAMAVGICNRVYLSGWGSPIQGGNLTTNGMEFTNDAEQTTTDGGDVYLMVLSEDAADLVYASYFGGASSTEHVDGGTSRFDKKGNIYQSVCAGCGGNSDFPIEPDNAYSPMNNSPNCNNAVFKMDFELPGVVADFTTDPICAEDTAHFINTSLGGVFYHWDFGDNGESDEESPGHVYEEGGEYEVTLIVTDSLSCNISDTITQSILVIQPEVFTLDTVLFCEGETGMIGIPPFPEPGFSYSWNNQDLLDNPNISNPNATIAETTIFELTIDNGECLSTAEQVVIVEPLEFELSSDTLICSGTSIDLTSTSFGTSDVFEWASDASFTNIIGTDSVLSITPIATTTLYARTGSDCKKGGQVTITLSDDQLEFSSNVFVCLDDTVTISLTNLFPEIDLVFDWSPDAPIISGDGTDEIQVLSSIPSQWFVAEVVNEYGCLIVDSVLVEGSDLTNITIDATAEANSIPLGGETTIMVEPSSGFQYQWTPGTGLSNPNGSTSTASPTVTTTYTVNVIDGDINGQCLKRDTVTIEVFEFLCGFPVAFLPNSFSPNGDLNNDVLYVRGAYLEYIHLAIYDRWGELVFETEDIEKGWDGTYKGRELDPDVYVYHLTLGCIDGQQNFEKGNITLLR